MGMLERAKNKYSQNSRNTMGFTNGNLIINGELKLKDQAQITRDKTR